MAVALITNYLSPYRVPLYERLAERHDLEVLCFGGDARYVPPWFSDLDSQLAAAPFPARRLTDRYELTILGRRYDAVIAPYAGGIVLPAAYAGTKRFGSRFVLWASVWAQPRSPIQTLALPATHHIYRHADAVIAYGSHVRRFVASIRGRRDDVYVAPQSVEPDLFSREVTDDEVNAFRKQHGLPSGPLVLYTGRLAEEKGIRVLADAWRRVDTDATLVVIGDGPLAGLIGSTEQVRLLGALPRTCLPVAYAAAELTVVPSVPTPRFLEPWGLVCNEALHQARPVIATSSVGAVAGGLVQDGRTGLVVAPGDPAALGNAIERLLADAELRARLGAAGREAVAAFTYERMAEAFDRALSATNSPH